MKGQQDIARILIKKGADVNARDQRGNKWGPLIYALMKGYRDLSL